jgi:hypothetical protein
MFEPDCDDDSNGQPSARPRYRTVSFADGLLVFDRQDTSRWIHADSVVPLTAMR